MSYAANERNPCQPSEKDNIMSEELTVDSHGKIIVFGAKQIRRTWHEEQWYFSVVDIIAAVTDSDNPRNYWNMMKARELKQGEVELSTFCVQLKLTSAFIRRTAPSGSALQSWAAFLASAGRCGRLSR